MNKKQMKELAKRIYYHHDNNFYKVINIENIIKEFLKEIK